MTPQSSLDDWGAGDAPGELTDAEREAWSEVVQGDMGVREYARETDRAPGTVGNLLRRAREKVNEGDD